MSTARITAATATAIIGINHRFLLLEFVNIGALKSQIDRRYSRLMSTLVTISFIQTRVETMAHFSLADDDLVGLRLRNNLEINKGPDLYSNSTDL